MKRENTVRIPQLSVEFRHRLYPLIRRTIFPYVKFFYHRWYVGRMRRRILKYGEEAIVRRNYRAIFGYFPDLKNPRTFNEKLAWLKVNVHDPLMTKCADKANLREYVREKIGEEYVTPLIGLYERPEDIPFDNLPTPYVLKVNHSSGGNVFCLDKKTFNKRKALRVLKHHMKINAYYYSCEWAYKDIRPRVICEKVFFEESGRLPMDYKFLCFNGEPLLIQLDVDRFGDHRENYYDSNWRLLPVITDLPNADVGIAPPNRFEDMKKIARVLSSPFDFVRVDMYAIGDAVYVGEMTFYPGGGSIPFVPEQYELEYGEKIRLTSLLRSFANDTHSNV